MIGSTGGREEFDMSSEWRKEAGYSSFGAYGCFPHMALNVLDCSEGASGNFRIK